jgi:DNA polymerase-3 subunit alpha
VVNDKEIHFGLGPIKNLGEKPVSLIIEEREKNGRFSTLRDFCERVDLSTINRLKLESLIKAGAFDTTNNTRASMLAGVEMAWNYKSEMKSYLSKMETFTKRQQVYLQREEEIKTYSLYDKNHRPSKKPQPVKLPVEPTSPVWQDIPVLQEMSESDLQTAEYELLGLYISSHPLNKYNDAGLLRNFHTVEDIKEMPHRIPVTMGAVITNITEITVAKTKEKMGFLRLEDLTGTIEAVVFSKMYSKCKYLIIKGQPLKFDGIVQVTEADDGKVVKVQLNRISILNFTEGAIDKPQKFEVIVKLSRANDLAELLKKYSGNIHEISIILKANDGTQFRMPSQQINKDRTAFTRELVRLTNE